MNFLLINSNENNAFAAISENERLKVVKASEFGEERGISPAKGGRSPDKLINCLVKLRSEFNFGKIEAISVTVGPGSFTGIRVGLALAKGIAAGIDKKLIPINNFLLQLERIPKKNLNQKYCILIPAKGPVPEDSPMEPSTSGEYYYSIIENGELHSSGCLKINKIESIINKNTIIVGNFGNDSVVKHHYFEYLNLSQRDGYPKNDALNEADAMLSLTVKYFNDGMLLDPEKVEPVYIKEFQFKKIE